MGVYFFMLVHELKLKFSQTKNYEPVDDNELLDFAGLCYICGQISINEYRTIIKELEAQGATKPLFLHYNAN